ncbi:hypothetical protein D9756_010524 [Leucocoprinus leucothites]|uniref:FHA domain-containing protein n=1 Tax=Leucocoprinus leucothites TaxID=201217 RepID=A0A8H5CUS6_9AGAR|nr:hypothetical protein D9756_010524 [Leucoagaricus leucothites]
MWIITGPFDTENAVELSSQKSKLLKTGKSYPLGRKNQPLLVLNKKVSAAHCKFTVEECTLDDVHNPEKLPKLTFHNERDKAMRLLRGESQLLIESKMTLGLQDGDVIHIVTGIPIAVKWQPICCFSPTLRGKSNVSLETCARLGVSIVYTPNAHVTHHILPTYVSNASVAASLISAAQFVKFEWLLEILKNEASLEENFALPNISKFRPMFSPTLSPSQKVFKVWEPNEERFDMFTKYRFLAFGEKAREIESDLRELIKRGGGLLETFDVAGGVAKLHKALTRGQAKESRQLVVVADVKDMKAAIGANEWKKMVEEVQSFGLSITYPETVVQSVIDVEPSLLNIRQPSPEATNALSINLNSSTTASLLPNYVPNSIPDEPSIPPEEPPVRKRLARRATSRQPSVEPTSQGDVEEVKAETPKPRRLLLSRRGKTVEPGANSQSSSQAADAQPSAPVAPTPGRLRLKRRLGQTSATAAEAATQSQLPDILPSPPGNEPPLKKFKALFEASGPAGSGAVESFNENVNPYTNAGTSLPVGSQTQSYTSEGFIRRAGTGADLSALREEEEEEESLPTGRSQMKGTKRMIDHLQEGGQDVEMVDASAAGGDGQPARKRPALDAGKHVAPTQHSPTSKRMEKERKPGAPVGQPDIDAEFLKAVASTKKGKRAEDDFDREFNNLRISKSKAANAGQQQRDEEEEEWRRCTDFGDDTGLRGNFMVVLEMDIYKNAGDGKGMSSQGTNGREERALPDKWKDQPNFKKFKKALSEDNGFDVAPAHWKSKKSQRAGGFSQEFKTESRPPSLRETAKASTIINDNSDDEDQARPTFGKRKISPVQIEQSKKPSSRADSRAPSTRATSKAPGSRANSVVPPATKRTTNLKASNKPALFLDSDDDVEEVDEREQHRSQNTITSKGTHDDGDEDDLTLRSTKRSMDNMPERPRVGGRRRVVGADDDSDDDGAVFKGFGKGRRKR